MKSPFSRNIGPDNHRAVSIYSIPLVALAILIASLAASSPTPAQADEVGSLTQIDCLFDPIGGVTIEGCASVTGLNGPYSVTVSPNGNYVYAAANSSDTLTAYQVGADGSLTQLAGGGCKDSSGGACDWTDGLNGATSVTVSPNGKYVYASANVSNTLTAYIVGTADSSLTQLAGGGCKDSSGGACDSTDGLLNVVSVTVSPDSKYAYAAAFDSDTLTAYQVQADGSLTQLAGGGCKDSSGGTCGAEDGLDRPWSVTVSPNGNYVYAAAYNSNTLTAYQVQADGSLTQLAEGGCKDSSGGACGAEDGLDAAQSITASPNGNYVYAAAVMSDTLTAYQVQADGSLTQLAGGGCKDSSGGACDSTDGLNGARSVTVSPNGNYVYAAAFFSDALTAYQVTQAADSGTDPTPPPTTTTDPPPTTTTDTTAPQIDNFKVSRKRLRSRYLRRKKRKRVTFKYELSEGASVKLVVKSKKTIRRCWRKKNGKRKCRRSRLIVVRKATGEAGANKLKVKVRSRLLRRGLYKATLSATDDAGNVSKKVKTRFRVVR